MALLIEKSHPAAFFLVAFAAIVGICLFTVLSESFESHPLTILASYILMPVAAFSFTAKPVFEEFTFQSLRLVRNFMLYYVAAVTIVIAFSMENLHKSLGKVIILSHDELLFFRVFTIAVMGAVAYLTWKFMEQAQKLHQAHFSPLQINRESPATSAQKKQRV